MGTEVLQEMKQVADARSQLSIRGMGWRRSRVRDALSKLRLISAQPNIGDELKSWDVLRTANFAIENLKLADPVLDIGAFASEILFSLYKAGFSNLTGADLNPALRKMPHSRKIRYEVADFLHTPFQDSSFSLVTAISVIEHGYQPDRLLAEVARLLKPGGFFVASFDYWPERIATDGIKMFGMDWKIFSREDVHDLLERARVHGLIACGSVELDAKERPISCMERHYTFAWMALKKIS